MLEVKLYEVVHNFNERAEMGRVLVTPTIPENREPRPTGKIFVCCNRIFLTVASLENHKTDNTCRNSSSFYNNEEDDPLMSQSQALQCLFDSVKKKYSSSPAGSTDSTLLNQPPPEPDVELIREESSLTPNSSIKDSKGGYDSVKMNGLTNFSCRQCTYRTTNLHFIKRHVKNMHANIVNNDKDIEMELGRKNVKTLYTCDLCHIYKTPYKYNVNLHKQNAHVENGKHPCPHCTCCYLSQSGLTVHMRTFHRDKIGSMSSQKKNSSTSKADDNLFVPIVVKTKKKQSDGMKTKSNLEVSEPGSSISCHYNKPIGNASKDKTLNGASMLCGSCGFIAKDKAALNSHLEVAHVAQGVACECGCSFATATNLTNHKLKDCPRIHTQRKGTIHSPLEDEQTKQKQEIGQGGSEAFDDSLEDSLSSSKNREEELKNMKARESRVRCNKCGLLFKNHKGLTTHYSLTHGMLEVSHKFCELCNYRTKNYQLYRKHKKMCHVVDGIKCPAVNCTCSFKGVEGLSFHFSNIHKQKLDRNSLELKCDKCDYVTYKESAMDRHIKRGHEIKSPRPVSEPTTHKCELCDFITPTWSTLEVHKETNHVENGFKCDFCNNRFKTAAGVRSHSFLIHKKASHNLEVKTYKCDHCDFTANLEGHLDAHIATNHVEDGFNCQFCTSSFGTTSGLRIHITMIHKKAGQDEYSICKLCGYRTGTKKNYKEHYERCHVGPVKCPDCVCSFKHIEGLSRHVQVLHKRKLDLRPYLLKCSFSDCSYSTYHNANLRLHEKSVHLVEKSPDDNCNQEECTICKRKISGSMEDHLSRAHVEGGFACTENECKCSFRTELGLRRHVRGIHGKKLLSTKENVRDPAEYPVKCDRCNFRCKVVGDLNRHCTKMHGFIHSVPRKKSNNKKNKCDICKAETSETLASHKMRYHVKNGFKCLKSGCPCSFETFVSRARHMVKAHQIVAPKICQICKLKYVGTLKSHLEKSHVENGVKCMHGECPCTFETEMGRAVHMRVQHNEFLPKKLKKCHICGNTVSEAMQQHIERCHVQNGMPCGFCSCSFETEIGLARHMRSRHNVQVSANCTICGIEPVVSMNAHMKQSHVPGGIRCSECECTFQSDMSKIRHLARYHNIIAKPAPKHCSLCDKIVTNISLNEHMQRLHAPNGYPCKYCNCTLRTKKGKYVHMYKMHKNEVGNDTSMFSGRKCKLCGLKVSESIEKHLERNHSSLNSFKCPHCCSKFSTSKGRIRHIICCHKKGRIDFKHGKERKAGVGIKSTLGNKLKMKLMLFPCPECSCKFVSKTARDNHIQRIHSTSTTATTINSNRDRQENYRDKEDVDLESKESIDVKEVEIESSKLKLNCPDCGYAAKSKSQLNMHMQKSHVKESAFSCTFCTCSYATEKELVRHQKLFHIKEYLRSKNSILALYGVETLMYN